MLESLLNRPIQYIFAAAGIILVFLSMFAIEDITKLQVTFVSPIRIAPLAAGATFIMLSLVWYVAPYLSLPLSWTALAKIKRTPHGFKTSFNHAPIEVSFGRIEELYQDLPGCLIALPANNLFDDRCIYDSRSALGGFVNSLFPNQVPEVCRAARKAANALPLEQASSSSAQREYAIGTSLYFDQPLKKPLKMAFLAVTTVVKGEGIRCEAADIFTAVKGLYRLMNTERLDSVVIPVVGSGHGALRHPVCLMCMLIAFAEYLRGPSGSHIRYIRIVVFQKGNGDKPAIPRWQVRRLLAFVQGHC